jgi:Undecaprenyl-phosphate glucose phosphotransferase
MLIGTEADLNLRLDVPRATFPSETIPYLLSTTDALIVLVASVAGAVSYHTLSATPLPDLDAYFALGLIASFIHIVRQSGRSYYDFEQAAKPGVEIVEILICWFSTVLLLAFFAFLFKIGVSFSRGSFLVFSALAPVGLLAGRKFEKTVISRAVERGAIGRRNVVLVGDPEQVEGLESRDLLAMLGAGQVNWFPLVRADDPMQQTSCDLKELTSVAKFIRENACSELLLAVPWQDSARIDCLREQIKLLPVSAKLLPDGQIRKLSNYASSARQRILSIELQRAPLSVPERIVKRTIDIALSITAIVFFFPVLALCALAVKLEGPGPVIFRQTRKGFNGHQFTMYKFRTMTVQENGNSVTQAVRNDPRVTRIGKLLRASSMDELPQLLNVLIGDMSLIGPRPHALAHDNQFEKVLSDYAFRHHMKPGMTGWAQVNGLRGATPTVDLISRRVTLDLWYINNWSLWLDVQILIKTFFEVVRSRNAF